METILGLVRKNLQRGKSIDEGVSAEKWDKLLRRYSDFSDNYDDSGFMTASEVRIKDLHTPRPSLHLLASTI